MTSSLIRPLILAASFALSLPIAVAVPAAPAVAACVQSGGTVTCSGATSTGFGTGVESNLTLTVKPDASITVGAGQSAINLGAGNIATNGGALIGNGADYGMQGQGGNIFTNSGAIENFSIGMAAFGNNNSFTNAGTISSLAPGGYGMFVQSGSGNTLLNSGKIDLGGNGSIGIFDGGNGTVTNSGTIAVGGTSSFGIFTQGIGNAVLNSGSISVSGTTSLAVLLWTGNTLTNTGTITATGLGADAVTLYNPGNTVINHGTISVTNGGALSFLDSQETVINNGTIKAGANGYTLVTGGSDYSTITNNGTLDGKIYFAGVGNSLINAGLITITDPGTALGTGLWVGNFAFSGTFTQTVQGTLALRVDNAGNRDILSVENASLNGTLRAVLQPGLYQSSTIYNDILQTTAGINGQFATVTSSSAFFNATATYNANSVDLTLTRQGFGAVAGETANQRSIGNALEAGYSTALTGAAATFYSNLLQADSLRVLDQLSGEGASATQSTAFNAGALFGQTMDSQMTAWRAGNRGGVAGVGALGYAAERPSAATSAFAALKAPAMAQPQWNVWGSGFGAGQQLSGNASTGSASFSDRAAGGSAGVDRLVNPDLLVGIAAGGSSATFSVDDRATSGRLEGAHVGVYAMQRFGASYLSAQLAWSHFNNTTTRTITGVGATETAQGSFTGDQLGGRLEIGRSFDFGYTSVTPFAAIQAARLWQGAYTETSTAGAAPGVLGLSYAAQTVTSLPASLGVKFDGRVEFGNGMVWSPFVHAAWVHEFEPSRTITASLVTVPVLSFTIAGASAASDSARLDLGSRLALNRFWELSGRVTGEFSTLGQSYSGMGALKASW
ncbi:autotransporter domain-containing protein [Bradyrhizobium liaoningense]|uniref:autotransporter outer membrane beta-barrel domain-containing protein n=1 Tax=Bradyrhizobium liaoningense TaxID=43992 RepID=UPI001BAB90C6|nr:autotransporter outer membrane beta-barrel domain-containing protein [Bradyrhizobium liaoningense]MBR0712568.1 autotransporter domain-containing protein [Bradyrhizobium liaoningense]